MAERRSFPVLFLHPSSDVQAPGDGRQEGAEHVRGVDAVESEEQGIAGREGGK